MQYDPIKRILGNFFNRFTLTHKLFFRLLDLLLLRAWHVHRELRRFFEGKKGMGQVAVLDAGSGFGQYVYYIARKNPTWSVLGIDVKEEEVKACNEFFSKTKLKNVRFEKGYLEQLTEVEKFDLVLSVDVMEHVEADEQVFANFFEAMKPGAILLVSTPSDKGGSDAQHHSDHSFIEEHVRNGYGRGEIEQKLTRVGFDRVETRYTYGWPGKISWKLTMKFPLKLIAVSKIFLLVLPFYYLVAMPPALVLNWLDTVITHAKGTGLLVKAQKTVSGKQPQVSG